METKKKNYKHVCSKFANVFYDSVQLCKFLEIAQKNSARVTILTRHINWDYRSRTRYNSYEIPVNDVKLVGARAPKGCG